MSAEKKYVAIRSAEDAAEYGMSASHLFEHLVETVLCVTGDDERIFDLGFYSQFTDADGRVWTLSVIPEDGGVISDALVDMMQEGDDS